MIKLSDLTHHPCWNCFKLLANAGIKAIVYDEAYRVEPRIESYAKVIGISVYRGDH